MLNTKTPREPEPKPTPPRRVLPARFLQSLTQIALGVLIALSVLAAYQYFNPAPPRITQRDVDNAVMQAIANIPPPPPLGAEVYQLVRPSVVQIQTRVVGTDGKSEGGRGSGVVLDEMGSILTSLHVVANAVDVKVIFFDGSESEASIVAKQPENDIAVLRAKLLPDNLVPATLGNPRALHVGEEAFVIGSPFGITGSFTAGVISGLGRTFKLPKTNEQLKNLIQFDAAVNPGNSGGPLINRYGEVVGVITGLVNPTEQDVFIGIGFAVPIDTAASAAGSPPY